MTKVKDKERILKAAREKQRITYKGIRQKLYKTKVSGMTYSKCWKEKISNQEFSTQQSYHSELRMSLFKSFPNKQKVKEFKTTKPGLHKC